MVKIQNTTYVFSPIKETPSGPMFLDIVLPFKWFDIDIMGMF
jgi:hypothetical protein